MSWYQVDRGVTMNDIATRLGLQTLTHLRGTQPRIAEGLADAAAHLRTTGSFSYNTPSPFLGDSASTLSALQVLQWHAPQHFPPGMLVDNVLDDLANNVRVLGEDSLPTSPDAPLYRLPKIIEEVTASIDASITGADRAALANADQARADETRRAALRVAEAIGS